MRFTRKLCFVSGQRGMPVMSISWNASVPLDLAGDALPVTQPPSGSIEHRGRDAGDEVCSARAAGCDGDTHLARRARIAICHVRGSLLEAHEDVVNGKLAQRIIDRQNCAAGIAEDVSNALTHERGPQDF